MRPGCLSWPETGAASVAAAARGACCHPISRGTGGIAKALAAGTGRRLTADAAAPFGPCDLLIALADDLTDRHLDAVEATVGTSVPGIIVGRDLTELAEKAAASLAALKAPIEKPPLRIEIVPALPIALARGEGFALAGRHADPAALRDLLAQGDSLVSLTGHGDGIDGDLGPLVLCPLDRAFLTGRSTRAPTCRISGHCHRSDTGLTSQAHAERHLHPSAIRARALVWNTCIGWPSRQGFVDREFGAGLRLAASAAIGALVTTSRISLASPVTIDALTAALLRGVPIGEAVAAHNASPSARRAGHRLLLFGDPLLRLAPDPARHVPAEAPVLRTLRGGPARPLAVRPAAANVADGGVLAAVARLRTETGAQRENAFAEICAAVAREGLEGLWARRSTGAGTADGRCPHCRAPASRLSLQVAPDIARHLLICRACEVAADIPERPVIAVRLQARDVGRIAANSGLTGTRWLGAIVSRRCRPYATQTRPWPRAADGRPARRVDLGIARSAAPTTIAAIFLAGGRLHIYSRPYPAAGVTWASVGVKT